MILGGVITKNEERDIARCVRSLARVVDGVVLVDTGSTDRTNEVAQDCGVPVHVVRYTDASEQNESGEWMIQDFAKAKNAFVEEIERRGADHLVWLDADEELLHPELLRDVIDKSVADVIGLRVQSEELEWTGHRAWKIGRGVRFAYQVHEYPQTEDLPSFLLGACKVRHDRTAVGSETSNARNLRILLNGDPNDHRTAFYLGQTLLGAKRPQEAAFAYGRRIALGEHYRDEWLFAHLHKGICERAIGDLAAAEATLLAGVAASGGAWAEFWVELSLVAFDAQRFEHALAYASRAIGLVMPFTDMPRSVKQYGERPMKIASLASEALGNRREAIAWALRARALAGADFDWDRRIADLGVPLSGTVILGRERHVHSAGFDELAGAVRALTDRTVVFNAHVFPAEVPDGAIVYNLENVNLQVQPSLFHGRTVWDWSEKNVDILRSTGVDAVHVPIGYHPSMERFTMRPPAERDIDVIFVGSLNDRRVKVLNELHSRGLKVQHVGSIYGAKRDEFLSRSKLALNMLFHPYYTFAALRVSHLIANRVPVLSERSSEEWDFISTCEYTELADAAEALIRGGSDLSTMADEDYSAFVKRPMVLPP
jgi:tetratricopeptide (TPR) repeat protein